MKYRMIYQSPIGQLTAVSDETYLQNLSFTKNPMMHREEWIPDVLQQTKRWLDDYFGQKNPAPDRIPFVLQGTIFQQTVWKVLQKIPYGKVTTYGALAEEVANILHKKHMSAQAVGNAVGKNPISILVPCHRVIGFDGKVVGYAGGADTKISLLQLEHVLFEQGKMRDQTKWNNK